MRLSLVPDTIRSDSQWRERVKETADFYETDLPSPLTLDAELDCWENKWTLHCGSSNQSTMSLFKHTIPQHLYSSENFMYTACHNK